MEIRSKEAQGGILVVCDAPAGLDFGIDMTSYETGANFRGVSIIPPGLHFIYHSTGMGARQGFFLFVNHGDLHVRSWDASTEEITARNVLSDESMSSLQKAIQQGALNNQLGPYPYSQHHLWLNLSGLVTESVLKRADCLPGTLLLPGDATDMINLATNLSTSSSSTSAVAEAVMPFFPDCARVARFADIAALEASLREAVNTSPEAGRAQALTAMHMDKSPILEALIDTYFDSSWEEFLGELQLSFLLFLLLYSHPALEFWKAAVHLVCNSERLLCSQTSFTSAFIRSFYEQLCFSPADFFESELSRDNFLRPAVSALFSAISEPDLPAPLPEHRKRLLKFLRKKFNLFETPGEGDGLMSVDGAAILAAAMRGDDEMYNLVEEDMPVVVMDTFTGDEDDDGDDDIVERASSSSSSLIVSGSKLFKSPSVSREGGGVSMHESFDPEATAAALESIQQSWRKFDETVASMSRATLSSPLRQVSSSSSSSSSSTTTTTTTSPISQRGCGGGIGGCDTPTSLASGVEETPAVVRASSSSPSSSSSSGLPPFPSSTSPMTPAEIERGLFSWRYPVLYEEMLAAQGSEDMVMTAVRVLGEEEEEEKKLQLETEGSNCMSGSGSVGSSGGGSGSSKIGNSSSNNMLNMLRRESRLYIECEIQKQSH